ncbi:hypothetical protein Sjap_001032 [Stephania japonica]|uniref:Homeobox domain-containing protein n=1 Tax=Stephania japonica TaxID=461633 RepID=A0AAP0KJ76_9MAGN
MDEEVSSGFRVKYSGTAAGNGRTTSGGTKCGRWNPTAEQVKVLTDLFTSGLRTPSTDQIQKISSQLSFYGKIESKNVFYWFQNHKARERQKRRRIINSVQDRSHHHYNHHHHHQQQQQQHCDHQIDQEPNSFSSFKRNFGERNHQIMNLKPQERVMETLQLFPLNSFEESEWDRHRFFSQNDNEYREMMMPTTATMFSCGIGRENIIVDHPPLDLRLSFLEPPRALGNEHQRVRQAG